MATFLDSLRVMAFGMIGIFSVTLILMGIMYLLTRIFPPKKEEKDTDKT